MRFLGLASLPVVILVALPASARDFRVNDIPNGAVFTCLNCHMTTDGKTFTPFGSDARCHLVGNVPTDQQHVDWLHASASGACGPLYLRDSDGDGYPNGVELGDPNGTWTPGAPTAPGMRSNPGDPDSVQPPVCNDGKLEKNEDCDAGMMSTTDCLDINLGIGTLKCGANCHFDTSACSVQASGSGGTDDGSTQSGCTLSSPSASGSFPTDAAVVAALGSAAVLQARRRRRLSPNRRSDER